VKGHVTLKTGVMMINSGINYTLLDIHREQMIFILFDFFLLYFKQINAALSRRDSNR